MIGQKFGKQVALQSSQKTYTLADKSAKQINGLSFSLSALALQQTSKVTGRAGQFCLRKKFFLTWRNLAAKRQKKILKT